MTTHETQPEARETVAPTELDERSGAAHGMPAQVPDAASQTPHGSDVAIETGEPIPPDAAASATAARTDAAPGDLGASREPVESTASAAPDDQLLFADGEFAGMRSRWTEVQSAFVDDPRDCVQKADRLVADVVDKLTAGFSAARARLEEQWDRGEQVSTEDLRIALKRYRAFFERLLAV